MTDESENQTAGGEVDAAEPVVVEIIDAETTELPSATTLEPADESTVGTGSVFAVGCSIFALLFIVVAVCIFMWRQVN